MAEASRIAIWRLLIENFNYSTMLKMLKKNSMHEGFLRQFFPCSMQSHLEYSSGV
ncbi:MAG: hypothetical protein J7L12_03250 [Desulfurococcales archaeon]|nr:hypothetical protein [Desulfurococcales archaeon]